MTINEYLSMVQYGEQKEKEGYNKALTDICNELHHDLFMFLDSEDAWIIKYDRVLEAADRLVKK